MSLCEREPCNEHSNSLKPLLDEDKCTTFYLLSTSLCLTFPSFPLPQSYMEDHLKNKDRLEKEWEALCAYQAEPSARTIGLKDGNAKKNRSAAVIACNVDFFCLHTTFCKCTKYLLWESIIENRHVKLGLLFQAIFKCSYKY